MPARPTKTLSALATALLLGACTKEPRVTVGPLSIALPPGFVDDAARAQQMGSRNPLEIEGRVWLHPQSKLQVALNLSRMAHQPEWEKVSSAVLLTEMFNSEKAAGEKANLKTVDYEKRFEGEALHYTLEGDMEGRLATSSHTVLWVDGRGDCWHASAVCTSKPAERARCTEIIRTVRFDLAGFDAGSRP